MKWLGKYLSVAMIALIAAASVVETADARRAGGMSGFGSRGTRTWSTPSTTTTAPGAATGIERSMTPRTQAPNTAARSTASNSRFGGMFGGLAGGLLGGMLLGGLFGSLFGTGFGGGFGFIGMLLQMALIFFLVRWAMRAFSNRQPSYAGPNPMNNSAPQDGGRPSFRIPSIGGGLGGALGGGGASAMTGGDELGIPQSDLETFERLLKEMQAAYGAEDYAALRRITTPEAMSYLAEELGENATKGVKNEVRDVELLQGDVAESWSENGQDYATVAMRYSSIDYMVERATGKVVSGDDKQPGESIEVWTFVRRPGTRWEISAIQAAS